MTTIVIVNKSGELKDLVIKDLNEDELYKKCGFRKNNNFNKCTLWKVDIENKRYNIELYAKNDGKANTENKYDFPPPIDTELYFGNCCLINRDEKTNNIIDITSKEWLKIYDKLFGGFYDLDDEELSEDELDNIPDEYKTKSGYLKDGFVVDSDEINETQLNENVLDEYNSDNNSILSELSEEEYDYDN